MPKRSRFSLRTLLVLPLVISLVLGLFVAPGLHQSHRASVLLEAGACVEYAEPAVPACIVDSFGHHFFQPITHVSFVVDFRDAPIGPLVEPSVRIVESPERLLPVLRQLHGLQGVTVSPAHHQALIEQLDRQLPGLEIHPVNVEEQ